MRMRSEEGKRKQQARQSNGEKEGNVKESVGEVEVKKVPHQEEQKVPQEEQKLPQEEQPLLDAAGPWSFESSKGDASYVVKFNASTTMLTCNCPGFKFRRSCKHVKEIQNAQMQSQD